MQVSRCYCAKKSPAIFLKPGLYYGSLPINLLIFLSPFLTPPAGLAAGFGANRAAGFTGFWAWLKLFVRLFPLSLICISRLMVPAGGFLTRLCVRHPVIRRRLLLGRFPIFRFVVALVYIALSSHGRRYHPCLQNIVLCVCNRLVVIVNSSLLLLLPFVVARPIYCYLSYLTFPFINLVLCGNTLFVIIKIVAVIAVNINVVVNSNIVVAIMITTPAFHSSRHRHNADDNKELYIGNPHQPPP